MNSLLHLHFKLSRLYTCSFVNSGSTWWNPRSPSRTGRPRLAGRSAPSSGVEASWASGPPTVRSRRNVPTGSSAAVIWSRKQVFYCSKLSDSKKKWIMCSSHQFIITSEHSQLDWIKSWGVERFSCLDPSRSNSEAAPKDSKTGRNSGEADSQVWSSAEKKSEREALNSLCLLP